MVKTLYHADYLLADSRKLQEADDASQHSTLGCLDDIFASSG